MRLPGSRSHRYGRFYARNRPSVRRAGRRGLRPAAGGLGVEIVPGGAGFGLGVRDRERGGRVVVGVVRALVESWVVSCVAARARPGGTTRVAHSAIVGRQTRGG